MPSQPFYFSLLYRACVTLVSRYFASESCIHNGEGRQAPGRVLSLVFLSSFSTFLFWYPSFRTAVFPTFNILVSLRAFIFFLDICFPFFLAVLMCAQKAFFFHVFMENACPVFVTSKMEGAREQKCRGRGIKKQTKTEVLPTRVKTLG